MIYLIQSRKRLKKQKGDELKMKKTISALLVLSILVISVFSLASCGKTDISGTYYSQFETVGIKFTSNEFKIYLVDNEEISISGTYELAYDPEDNEPEAIKFSFSGEVNTALGVALGFAFDSGKALDFDYDKDGKVTKIEIADMDFYKQ